MRTHPRLGMLVLTVLLVLPLPGGAARAAEEVDWCPDLPMAFALAKSEGKVLMVCVNAKTVAGRSRDEPAAKALREDVYRDARVVEASRNFVCALLTKEGTADDFGELRALGIDGRITSPQHIFVHPDGTKILLRREYWSHGGGDKGVQALLDMMAKAQERFDAAMRPTDGTGDGAGLPPAPEGAERPAWIAEMAAKVFRGSVAESEAALKLLVESDQDGDCTTPLVEELPEHKKNVPLLVMVIRALGRDGLVQIAEGVAEHLKHKDPSVRGNAAVSLEYIGSRDKKVVAALRKAADKEKDEAIANHLYRALGRCGVEDAKVRTLLLKKAGGAKSEFASYGPTIGLAYFTEDIKAARGVEKLLKAIGVPGTGRRGGGQNTVKRGVMSWTLAAIGDTKSGDFVREELIAKLENMQAFWVDGLRGFYEGVAEACDAQDPDLAGVEEGVRTFVSFAKRFDVGRYGAETRGLMDEYRRDRDDANFRPKGDNLLGGAGDE